MNARRRDAASRRASLVVDGVETPVDVIALESSELCAIPSGADGRIALIVERSTEPGWREPISIARVTSLDDYAVPAWRPGR
ncbi:hypothetical protein [Myceligenerans pegani]|uniref:Uncharacterized protein n=1 Tax=Myceligenerans pegani TaxID=2776917 RepID=A0ABR9N3D9_9MICO|nr:hypothetical protein [Myceligenerans sp. TRM 65318]MBE1878177.1 hypothetical protein [Myceligenerans sp. TRM 65318]MBE3020448.1 hypothetical protein [Myceligenerans sp. TRM 65318]